MDNLTHSLAGAALGETRLGSRTPLARPALILGANLPDIDALAYFRGSDFGLLCRRGWTHGVLAMAVLPLLLTAALLLFDRLVRRRRHPDAEPVRPAALVLLSALGILSHPALDLLNTYGVRLLMPFDGRWFYGDAMFILDPWAWLLLGGAVFLARAHTRASALRYAALAAPLTALVLLGPRSIPFGAKVVWTAGITLLVAARATRALPRPGLDATRLAALAVAAFTLYAATLVGLGRAGQAVAREELAARGFPPPEALLVSPRPANPFTWDVTSASGGLYRFATLRWLGGGGERFEVHAETAPRPEDSPVVRAALAAPSVRGLANWLRFPLVHVREEGDGYVVRIDDARFARRPAGSGLGGTVQLDRELRPLDPRRR